jgi:hypothetical protein
LIYFRVKNILKTIAIRARVSSLNQVANMNVYVQITWQTSKSYTSNSFNLPIRYDTATSCSFIARNPWGHYRVRVRVTRPNSKVTHHRSTFRAHVQLIKPGPSPSLAQSEPLLLCLVAQINTETLKQNFKTKSFRKQREFHLSNRYRFYLSLSLSLSLYIYIYIYIQFFLLNYFHNGFNLLFQNKIKIK